MAGVDTTSNALSRVLHLLAQNESIQVKLRTELHAAQDQYGRDIPYDELGALPYLDAVCRETLRLYASCPSPTETPDLPTRHASSYAPVSLSNRQYESSFSVMKITGIVADRLN